MPGHFQYVGVIAQDEAGVGGKDDSVELEREGVGIFIGRQLVLVDRGDDEPADQRREAALERCDPFLDGSWTSPHLQDGPGEEAATGKRPTRKVVEERIAHGEQLSKPRSRGERRLDDFGSEDALRFIHGRKLEVPLRAEVGVHAALAHAETVGEIADRKTFETIDGCKGNGLADDRFPRTLAVRPLPSCWNNHDDKIARSFVLCDPARTVASPFQSQLGVGRLPKCSPSR